MYLVTDVFIQGHAWTLSVWKPMAFSSEKFEIILMLISFPCFICSFFLELLLYAYLLPWTHSLIFLSFLPFHLFVFLFFLRFPQCYISTFLLGF